MASSAASRATGDGVGLPRRPEIASGRVRTAITSCRGEAIRRRSAGTAGSGVPANTRRTAPPVVRPAVRPVVRRGTYHRHLAPALPYVQRVDLDPNRLLIMAGARHADPAPERRRPRPPPLAAAPGQPPRPPAVPT